MGATQSASSRGDGTTPLRGDTTSHRAATGTAGSTPPSPAQQQGPNAAPAAEDALEALARKRAALNGCMQTEIRNELVNNLAALSAMTTERATYEHLRKILEERCAKAHGLDPKDKWSSELIDRVACVTSKILRRGCGDLAQGSQRFECIMTIVKECMFPKTNDKKKKKKKEEAASSKEGSSKSDVAKKKAKKTTTATAAKTKSAARRTTSATRGTSERKTTMTKNRKADGARTIKSKKKPPLAAAKPRKQTSAVAKKKTPRARR